MTCRQASTVAWLLLALAGCERPRPPAAPAAEKPRSESDLARTTISLGARKSLGIEVVPVRTEEVQERRTYTGWVTARPEQQVTVTAPLAGMLRAPAEGTPPAPGQVVRAGQELFRLQPVLSPLEQVQLAVLRRGVEGDLEKAREAAELADIELKRVAALYEQKLRGQQEVEQARSKLKLAQADVAVAQQKLKLFEPGPDNQPTGAAVQTITAPRGGTVLAVDATPGQVVAAASPLVRVADLSRPWVRVSVPEYDLPRIDHNQPATVIAWSPPSEKKGARRTFNAKPVALVPHVDPVRHTADLLYEPEDAAGLVVAREQMVTVLLPAGGKAKESVVPYSAVIFDAHGGTWVYVERSAADAKEQAFERLRVDLGAPLGDDVVVHPPLRPGERVVSVGAAALFSREFHRPPVHVAEKAQVDDDD